MYTLTIEQINKKHRNNEREDVGYELFEVNRQEQGQRRQPRYLRLVINFDELREPVLEYAD